MTTRIKGTIRNNGLTIHGTEHLDMHLVNNAIGILNEENNANIAVNNNTNHLNFDNDATHNVQPDGLLHIRIKFGAKKVGNFGRLAMLRDLVKTNTNAAIGSAVSGGRQENTWEVMTTGLRYDSKAGTTTKLNDENDFGLVDGTAHILTFNADKAYKTGAKRTDILSIDDQDFAIPANGYSYKLITDEFWTLVDLLENDIEKMLRGDEDINKSKIDGWLVKLKEYAIATNVAKNFLYATADFGANFGGRFF